ncbi:Putative Zinc finger C2H2-type [Septoria linicola]|uniref:Zinc finger C2H2-type n=1 Tax=Septoria linicola TaxID=215465 RepID=A0A9Q9AI04_9PEZI|nr:Putative Zinc finger C2H2-type [Septoria linicola]
MADSPASSDLSDPPSVDSDVDDTLSTPAPSSRPSVDITHADTEQPPAKRRRTGPSSLATFEAATPHPEDDDDSFSVSSDGYSSAPGSPNDDEWTLREQAQTQCLWKDCMFGSAENNDELVKHVQGTHCATGGPKKTKYVCEWGECQRKTSNHPSGYALKAHMRSHTKEKPYYCQLPECDKAFTRSDALAKHMRTVHEPEPARGSAAEAAPATAKGKASLKLKSNGGPKGISAQDMGPTLDEDGNLVEPSPANDNITYIPAHHPITGQPGFMIHYPPDIHFTAWESSITADQLMRLLRRQVHWAEKEGQALKSQVDSLEQQKRDEWQLKEILLEGAMEAELEQAEQDQILRNVDSRVKEAMEKDIEPAKQLQWSKGQPRWRMKPAPLVFDTREPGTAQDSRAQHTPSPPPTGASGGFDGEADPYDNYLAGRMAEYEERERMRSIGNTPAKSVQVPEQKVSEAEADAIGTLVGISGT